MNQKFILLFCIFLGLNFTLISQTDTTKSPQKQEKIKKKKRWSYNPLPVIGYDADLGFQLGALIQIFDYGDRSIYPEYRQTFYAEISQYFKGTGVYQFRYDSKYLIPGHIRLSADVTYLTDKALNFFGFNGYEAAYHHSYENQESPDSVYISRVYYRYERKLFRILVDFQGRIIDNKLRWLAGVNYFNIQTATVDINNINKGKKESKQLPDTALLYDDYVKYGLIKDNEKAGGEHFILKVGLVYDTRDNEPAPNRGIWSELLVLTAPSFFGNKPYAFTRLAVTHRQYISLVPKKLVFAYRLAYQGTIGGTTPFYILPLMITSYDISTKPDGLGGSRTMRGILLNRVVGDGEAYGNIELRWKFLTADIFKIKFDFGLDGFFDAGMVVTDRPVDRYLVPEEDWSRYFDESNDSPHTSWGLGLRVAVNDNFVIAIDYGFAMDRRDGSSGLYFGIGHIF